MQLSECRSSHKICLQKVHLDFYKLRWWDYGCSSVMRITQLFTIIYFKFYYFEDEWLACQRSWLYLEPIFFAPDIRRQLPNESKMFLTVDKFFKAIMQKTAKVRIMNWRISCCLFVCIIILSYLSTLFCFPTASYHNSPLILHFQLNKA